ncbi:MAG: hypothetical protein HY296_01540 [Thaumarchaeota archaeon]|nr:hypothetical protein [Nitrososphaerota archaeon]
MKVVLFGLGAIGTEILRRLVERSHDVVAVIDTDTGKAGKTVAELTGLPLGVRVQQTLAGLAAGAADVAVFSTKSRMADLLPDVVLAVGLGLDVVTTSEEMAFPLHAGGTQAENLDRLAKDNDVSVVGVGVNPGFVMDWVPAVVASASNGPTNIHVVRSVDVGKRRRQLQSKAGVGLTRAKFEREAAQGTLGHVGLVESAHLIARSLGGTFDDSKEGIFPVLGSEDYVLGVRQFVEGKVGACSIRLDLEMSTTSADFDVVEVRGDPTIKLRFEKGVFGDSATVALVVNAIERVASAKPGLITILQLPLARS